jgi:ferrous iron transport protein A
MSEPSSPQSAETATIDDTVPLSSLPAGAHAIISRVDASGHLGSRLLDLGLVPNTKIEVVRRAPLGDPIAFRFRGGQICLRGSDAARVRVRPEVDPDPSRLDADA